MSLSKQDERRRAIGIVRVSQVNGRDEGAGFASPGTQRDRMNDLCKREGLELIEVFEELDVSGSRPLVDRTGLVAAITAIEEGRAEVIVVAYFDRLVRSMSIGAEIVRRVEVAGGRVVTADIGEISNGTAANWLSATMLGMVAEYHNRITAEKMGEVQQAAIRRGVPPIILPPGLRKEGNGVVLDEETAPAVAEAVRLRADGATLKEVQAYLRANGIDRSLNGVRTLLGSRLLVGEIVFGKNRTRAEDVWRGECPAVVDRATWERAQRSIPRGPRPKSDRLLARLGVLRCGSCGARMVTGFQTAGGRRYPFYRCPPTGDCTARVTISAEVVERLAADAAREALQSIVAVRSTKQDMREAQSAFKESQARLDAAIRAFDGLSEPAAADRLKELVEARDQAQLRVEHLGATDDAVLVVLSKDWDDLSLDERRRCILATIESVVVAKAPRGTVPEDRIEVRPHAWQDVFARRVPPIPLHLS